jgi:hypothetical protein
MSTLRPSCRPFATACLVALALPGCQKQEPPGELVGVYVVSGKLTENTCGLTALPTLDPLAFQAEIRGENGIGYWQIAKQPAYTGELAATGEFRFVSEQSSLVAGGLRPRQDLEPTDFIVPDQDVDLDNSTCALVFKQVVSGELRRSLQALDGGIVDGGVADDLAGDHDIEVSPLAGSECTAQLAVAGGTFATLPCRAHYDLSGQLQDAIEDVR